MDNWYFLYLAQFSYFLTFVSYATRNITWLRVFALLSSSVAIYYGFTVDVEPLWIPILWNIAFVALNLGQLLLASWRKRNVALGPVEEFLHQTILGNFPPAEVKSFAKIGVEATLTAGEQLIQTGTEISELYCLLNGTVDIVNQGKKVAVLGPGRFVGEMSLLTKAKTRADVVAITDLRLLVWPHKEIERWVDTDTARLAMLQTALGTQVVEQLLKTQPEEEKSA